MSGANSLTSGAGNDTLIGGAGIDYLVGGSGSDLFVYTAMADSPVGGGDAIKDFDAITSSERLVLDSLLSGVFSFVGANAFTGGGNASTRFDDANDLLRGDANGDGSADMEITLIGVSGTDLGIDDFTYSVSDNTATTATSIGTVSASPVTGNDFVGDSDRRDWYRFTAGASGTLTASIGNMTANADLLLYAAPDGKARISAANGVFGNDNPKGARLPKQACRLPSLVDQNRLS